MKTNGVMEVQVHAFLTPALDGGEWSASRPGHFIPLDEVPRIRWIEAGWAPEPVWTRWRSMGYNQIVYENVSKSFRTDSITKYTLTFGITCWEATQRVMAAKLTRLTHKIAIQLHLMAEI
jgi:hypothetical protein